MDFEADARPGGSLAGGPDAAHERTLVERALDRLGPPRWVWMLAWGLVPFLGLGVVLILAGWTGNLAMPPALNGLVVPTAILAYAVVLWLWGLDRLMAGIRGLEPNLMQLATRPLGTARLTITNPVVPLLAAAALSGVDAVDTLARYGALAAAAQFPLDFVTHLPITSFGWAYLAFLVGLDRLGRHQLALDVFPQDRSLGLGPLGAVAFTGLWLVVAGVVPLLIANATDVAGALVSLCGIGLALLAFFLSMWRLHGQMTRVKGRYVAAARKLYAEAYEPLRVSGTMDVLRAEAAVLGAAQALEQRAQAIYEWPIDERTSARLAIIVTGVVTGVIVRVVTANLFI